MFKLIILLRPFARYLLIVWVLTIITISSIPDIPTLKVHTAKSEFRLDYLMHFCEYGFLTFLTFLSFSGSEFRINFRKIILIGTTLVLFALLDEFHQKLIPGRAFNVKDILSNIAGIMAAMIFTIIVFRSVRFRLKKSD